MTPSVVSTFGTIDGDAFTPLRFEARCCHAGLIRCDSACLLLWRRSCHRLRHTYAFRNSSITLRFVLRRSELRASHHRAPNCKRETRPPHADHTTSPLVNLTPTSNLSGMGNCRTRVMRTAVAISRVQYSSLWPHQPWLSSSLTRLILIFSRVASRWT